MTELLQSASDADLSVAIALLLLDAEDVLNPFSATASDDAPIHALRLATEVKSLASQRGLESVGSQGDLVEYLPLAHQTVS